MKKGNLFLDRLKKMPKNQLLIGGLVGILLLVIAIPIDKKADSDEDSGQVAEQASEESTGDYAKRMERRLKQILEDMEGVGKVEVMITLKDGGVQMVEKDRSQSSQNTQEQSEGTVRTGKEQQTQEETVYSNESGNSGEPFVTKETVPDVEGVLVVAEGGGNAQVAKNISDAVLALFPVEVHKIKVVKMN